MHFRKINAFFRLYGQCSNKRQFKRNFVFGKAILSSNKGLKFFFFNSFMPQITFPVRSAIVGTVKKEVSSHCFYLPRLC